MSTLTQPTSGTRPVLTDLRALVTPSSVGGLIFISVPGCVFVLITWLADSYRAREGALMLAAGTYPVVQLPTWMSVVQVVAALALAFFGFVGLIVAAVYIFEYDSPEPTYWRAGLGVFSGAVIWALLAAPVLAQQTGPTDAETAAAAQAALHDAYDARLVGVPTVDLTTASGQSGHGIALSQPHTAYSASVVVGTDPTVRTCTVTTGSAFSDAQLVCDGHLYSPITHTGSHPSPLHP